MLAETAEAAERGDDVGPGCLERGPPALAPADPASRGHRRPDRRPGSAGGARPSRTVDARDPSASPSTSGIPSTAADESAKAGWSARTTTGVLGTLALAAWKFKFLAFVVLGKAKLLLLGLTKASTFLSMFAMVGVYWTRFGFWFALGLVLSIYVHEMGHVAALARYGVPASAPLFIPGLGAVIRLKQDFTDPRQDARVGLAGPIWGLGAAVVLRPDLRRQPRADLGGAGPVRRPDQPVQPDADLAARRRPGLPQPEPPPALAGRHDPGDGLGDHRGGPALLIMLVAAARALFDRPSDRPDRGALVQYIVLVAALSVLAFAPALQLR